MTEKLAVIKINCMAKMVMSHGGKITLKVFNECYNPEEEEAYLKSHFLLSLLVLLREKDMSVCLFLDVGLQIKVLGGH